MCPVRTLAWTETYGFDGFGNLTSKVLNGTTTSIAVDGATNRLSSASYDANGNMTSGAGATLAYDSANRMKQVSPTSGGTEYYGYAPDNKRVFRVKPDGSEEWTLFGIGGEKIGTFTTSGPFRAYFDNGVVYPQWARFNVVKANVWFGGRLVSEGGVPVYSDRLGTNRASGARFRPYGDEITSTANDRVKFGTYTRDSFTGLDYADQRFYASSYGRFNTADPYMASAGVSDPGSWNRYAYVGGDPVNFNDARGLDRNDCSSGWMTDASASGPCTSGMAGVDLGGAMCGDLVFALTPACGPYGSGAAPMIFAVAYEETKEPLCPLVGITGSYTPGPGTVRLEFAPAMAIALNAAIKALNNNGIRPQINSGYRSSSAQGRIPRNNPNGVAPAGQSWHNVGMAVDIQLDPSTAAGRELATIVMGTGLTWGGTWSSPDNVHFQLPASKVNSRTGIVTSGTPDPRQVANCEAEHP